MNDPKFAGLYTVLSDGLELDVRKILSPRLDLSEPMAQLDKMHEQVQQVEEHWDTVMARINDPDFIRVRKARLQHYICNTCPVWEAVKEFDGECSCERLTKALVYLTEEKS